MKKQETHTAWREEIQEMARTLLAAHGLSNAKDAEARHAAIRCRRKFWNLALAPLATLLPTAPPEGTLVAETQGDRFLVQNIVFESFPGWRVGLNLFLPEGHGPFKPILCPCGHGPKWQDDHQIPPQVLARNGFAAALFDAPGFGEKTLNNNHFVQGAQAQLAGLWSHLFFLIDPIRVADYLETRTDIDASAGFGVTGVSGGGCTALSMIQADPRVRAVAPVCCLAEAKGILIDGLYTNCPEDYVPGQFTIGMDADDLLCMAAPVPCLAMGGTEDRFFTPDAVKTSVEKARGFYEDEGAEADLSMFFESTGHKYTAGMALEAAQWFRRWLGGGQAEPRAGATLLEPRQLDCGTTEGGDGMLDVIRREAATQRAGRTALADTDGLARVLKMTGGRRRKSEWAVSPDTSPWGEPSVARGSVRARGTVPLPVIEHRRETGDHGLLLAFTDGDKNTLLRELYPVRPFRRVSAVDLRGFGELAPAPSAHDVKPWCSIDRALSDLILMIGQTPAGMQTEDALRAIDAALAGGANEEPVTIMGRGEAALPALFAGLLHPRVQRIILDAFPASLEDLATAQDPAWRRYSYIPDVLRHFDLPELLAAPHDKTLLLINPMDAGKRRMDEIAALLLYDNAPEVAIHVDFGEAQAVSAIAKWLMAEKEPAPVPDSTPAIHGGRPVRTRPFPSPKMLGADLTGLAELYRVQEALASKTLFRHYGISEPRMALAFERMVSEAFHVRFALGVNSGSSALFCALAGLGVGPGDDVILSSFSWQAAYNAILRFGALPVFSGIDRTLNLDPVAFERCITPRTKAVIVVHFQGGPARMNEIRALAAKHGIHVLEDCAQSIGATFEGRHLGTLGTVGIYSFQGNKLLTSGEGGMLVTNDPVLFERAVRFHDLGLLRQGFANQLGREKEQATFPGEQFRMSELTAAVLQAQFERLPWINARCRRHWHFIRTEIAARIPDLCFRDSPDPQGDAGITLFMDLGTPAAARAVETALAAEGIPFGPSSGMSNLLQQAYIQNKTAIPEGIPPFATGCTGETVHYGPDLAPDTDDIIGAMVAIPIAPRYTDADAQDIVDAVIKLYNAGLIKTKEIA